jgi:hypothetical protein
MNTNATWTTDQGAEVRVDAGPEDKGFAIVTGEGGWMACLPESQLTRDEDEVHPMEWNGDHAAFEMRGRE